MSDEPEFCQCPPDEVVCRRDGRIMFTCYAAPWYMEPAADGPKCKGRNAHQPSLDWLLKQEGAPK